MSIDDGLGGEDTCEAETISEAMVYALAWADDGDWSIAQEGTEERYGGCGEASVRVWLECATCDELATGHDAAGDPACDAHRHANGAPLTEDEVERTRCYTIPTLGDLREAELGDDGEVLGEYEHEFSTESVVRIGAGDYYHRHENGGARGAWDRRDGDGVWRARPVEPTRQITRSEARALLLDWGYAPRDIARLTR
jgi:hypothetical protein